MGIKPKVEKKPKVGKKRHIPLRVKSKDTVKRLIEYTHSWPYTAGHYAVTRLSPLFDGPKENLCRNVSVKRVDNSYDRFTDILRKVYNNLHEECRTASLKRARIAGINPHYFTDILKTAEQCFYLTPTVTSTFEHICGFLIGHEAYTSDNPPQMVFYIDLLCSSQPGMGNVLLGAAEEFMRTRYPVNMFMMKLSTSSDRLVELYANHGFTEKETHTRNYKSGEIRQEHTMTKYIHPK